MTNYIPYPFFSDSVPVDISFVFEDEKPAGKHGFLGVKGRKFLFADGTEAKFWGTNFNGAGCFPEKDYAKTVAKRLAKTGINLVRFHQLDSEWHTPHIFAATKGKRITDGHLDPVAMDKLDYLVYSLKEEGIYIYLDMITYRKFRSDEGVENAHALADSAKPYSVFARKLIDLQKEFCQEIWTHMNPYTGLRYCDDPVFVLTEVTNECDLFTFSKPEEYVEPYKTEFYNYFAEWLSENGVQKSAEEIKEISNDDILMLGFKSELQKRYYLGMMDCMRKAGVKIPIAGTNWNVIPANYESQTVCDFLDTHAYHYIFGCWAEFTKSCSNLGVTQKKVSYLSCCGYMTAADLPTYISEWDMPWPNEHRAESVIYSAAIGAFQGWSGFAIHTYSYSTKLDGMKILGEEFSCDKIGNVPYRQGVFATWNDPAKFGLFYHAALITRRGDVKEGLNTYSVDSPDPLAWDIDRVAANFDRYKFVHDPSDKQGLQKLPADTGEGFAASDTGELYRNWEKNYGTIDTEMTKCAYGYLAKNGDMDLSGVKIRCKTDYAVIALSSLTKDPITASDNILLTTVGRAQNTDAKFSGELMNDIGKPPVIIENIEAEIEIETNLADLKVWAISAEGYYIGNVPTEYKDGKFKFRLGEISRSMYYLIVRS